MGIVNLDKPEVVLNFKGRIYVKENVLPLDICDSIIEYGDANAMRRKSKYSFLKNDTFQSCLLPLNNEAHLFLQDIWDDVISTLGVDVNFVEPYEYKKYTTGDHFVPHVDNHYNLTIPLDRKITMSVQLSHTDEYQGGALNILGEKYRVSKGSIICFPSFFNHSVENITKGTRKSLITWAWGPNWK